MRNTMTVTINYVCLNVKAVSTASGEFTLLNVKAYLNDTRLNYDAIYATYNTIKTLESKYSENRSTNPIVIVSR